MLKTIMDIADVVAPMIAAIALLLNWRAFRANAKVTDAAGYTKLADRIDDAYDGFRRVHRQYKSRAGNDTSERRYAAERLLAVIADSCHLYLSGLLLHETRKMVAEYLETILPLEYEYLREISKDPGARDPYRYIREFGEYRQNDEIVDQFPSGGD